jgi:hypothetical protein
MEVARTSETLVDIQLKTGQYIPRFWASVWKWWPSSTPAKNGTPLVQFLGFMNKKLV